MSRTRLLLRAALLSIAIVVSGGASQADGEDVVVARVGPVTITKAELERRISSVPTIQLATFGQGPEAIKRAYLEKIVVPEILLSQGARARKVDEREDVRIRVQDAKRVALMNALRKELVEGGAIKPDDVARYFEENREKFQAPERISIHRILVASKDEAQKIIDEVRKPGGEKRFRDLARDKSTDKATRERGGDLGFVGPDGQSNAVTVKVDPALYAAAKKVQNGELVGEPIKEGDGWAVVMRRGSLPPVSRTLEQEAASIKALLSRQRMETATKEIIERQRRDIVKDLSYDLLNVVEVGSAGEVLPRQKAGVSKTKATGKPQPSAGPDGQR